MKILWVANIPLPDISKDALISIRNTGGWLDGLSKDLLNENNIRLFYLFPHTSELKGSIDNLHYQSFTSNSVDLFTKVLKNEEPDIIHIFGTEFDHTLKMIRVCEKENLINKVIINIQGLVSVCSTHYTLGLPIDVIKRKTLRDFLKNESIEQQANNFKQRGLSEIESIKKVKNIIGRTEWDKACTGQINPDRKYFFCNETLRKSFYGKEWNLEDCENHSIFLSQCSYPIKGFHYMLEAMNIILKKYPDTRIYTTGGNPLQFSVKDKLKINSYNKYLAELMVKYNLQEKVTFLGSLNETQMCDRYLKSHVFVSASTIENSPNSVGEAMLLGVPTISSNVGGVSDMLLDKEEGFLYQSDAPYMLAHYVDKIFSDDELAKNVSKKAIIKANKTHNRKINTETMLRIYNEIIKK